MNVFELFASIELDDKGYLRSLDNAEGRTNRAADKMGRAFTAFGRAAAAGTVAAGAAITAMVGKGLTEFATLETGMNEVFSLMPDITQEAMDAMTDDVQAFAASMGVTTDEVVPALYNSISAGVPADNVFAFLETANMLAVGGVTELNTSVDALSSAVNAYGEDILSAQQASDAMFTAVRLGKTTVDELARAVSVTAPIAASLGISFEEVQAALAAMTSQGEPTATAATKIRQAMAELSKEGSTAFDAFAEAAGVTFPEFIAGGGTLGEALGVLGDHAESSGGRITDLFGSVEAGMAATILTSSQGAETFADNMLAMQDSTGATLAAFETMDEGVGRAFQRLRAQVEVFQTELGERFAPYVERVLLAALGFFDRFSAGALAFIDAIVVAYESGLFTMESLQDSQLGVLLDLWNVFYGAVEELFNLLGSLWTRVLLPVWSAIEPFVVDLADALVDALTLAFEGLESLFSAFNALLNGDFSQAWNLFGDAVANTLNAILGVADVVFSALGSVAASGARAVADVLAGAFAAAFDAIRSGINDAISSVNSVITRINRALEVNIPDIEFSIPNPLPGDNDWEISFNTPDIDPPDIPAIPALAKGGVVTEATLALVGEAGPEVVLPLDQYAALNGLGVAGGGLPGQVGMADAVSAFGSHVSAFGGYIDRLVTEGIAVNMGAASRTAALR